MDEWHEIARQNIDRNFSEVIERCETTNDLHEEIHTLAVDALKNAGCPDSDNVAAQVVALYIP